MGSGDQDGGIEGNAMTAVSSGIERDAVAGLLDPRNVAIIGASEDASKFGGRAFKYLLRHKFAGGIYPINPKRVSLLGHPAFPDIRQVPVRIDAALLAVPRAQAVEHIR